MFELGLVVVWTQRGGEKKGRGKGKKKKIASGFAKVECVDGNPSPESVGYRFAVVVEIGHVTKAEMTLQEREFSIHHMIKKCNEDTRDE